MPVTEDPKPTSQRFWEVDTARGIAVVLMVFYHFVFDLRFFGAYSGDMLRGPWQVFARSIGTTFIFIMGMSLILRYHQLEPRLDRKQVFRKYLVRGASLFGWGMIITIVTYFVVRYGFVVFGILHLMGLATILAYPLLRQHWASLVAGIVVIGLGVYAGRLMALHPWLLWLGMKQVGRYMVDYYPIFPWFGVALLGVFAGHTLYPGGIRRFRLPDLSHKAPVRGLAYLGRHSLPIYLIHQPVLLGILIAVGIGSI
jgi:uncharacterized membrane protein